MTPAPLDLTDRATALSAARRAGVSLTPRLGQHLLVDRAALEMIVAALAPGPADSVLEVGPGIGTLTVELARRAARVVAVELDPACVRAARRHTRGLGAVEVVEGDALRVEPAALGLGPGWLAAGNIPYTITGALLTHLLERPDPPARAVLLVQREVAARLAAGAGDWSLATLAVRSLATVERLGDVPPAAFEPPPRVWSSVLRLIPAAPWEQAERAAVLALARPAFQMRRKTLRHGITRALGGDAQAGRRALDDAGIDPRRRPGELDLDEWRRLTAAAVAPPL
ncbi:MAG TPA: 16S rRNA (adenine(1518)-N(6)/adenine(1519)-N(6))-dimethyltransferase RsmA [Candidatus Dormibacteraeota bacterium]